MEDNKIKNSTFPEQPVLLFDGVCNLCNGAVQFMLRADKRKKLLFTSLQSDAGQDIIRQSGYEGPPLSTVLLYYKGRLFTHADAGLEVCRILGGGWTLLYGLKIIPKPVRNAVYNWIARNRYRWFGKQETCWIPTPELKQRFL